MIPIQSLGWSLLLAGSALAQRPVTVVEVQRAPLETRSLLQAEVLPRARAVVIARLTGRVAALHVDEGDVVKAGQMLCEIACPDRDADLAIAEAATVAAAADVAVARRDLELLHAGIAVAEAGVAEALERGRAADVPRRLAAALAERVRALHAEGAATVEELERVEADVADHTARVATARAVVGTAEAELAKCRVAIARGEAAIAAAEAEAAHVGAMRDGVAIVAGFARVACPYPTARVTRRFVDRGTHVDADRTELFELIDATRVRIRCAIPESDAAGVASGATASIVGPGRAAVAATLTRATGAIDRTSRTMAVEIEFDNDGTWIPGALCQIDLVTRKQPDAITIPSVALIKDSAEAFVFVVEGQLAKRVAVTVGADFGRRVQITAGLDGGERIVVAGGSGLRDREPVAATAQER